jgi:ComF family protein
MRCRTREYAFTRNVSLFSYTGAARKLLQSYKFEGYKDLAGYFALELHRAVKTEFGEGTLPIVPVPSRKNRKKKQGWDHVERLTRILRIRYGASILPLLARKGTRAQKTLSYEERLLNMKGSIVPAGTSQKPADAVILLDDVFTTGATANECSFVLKQMGAKIVYVLTIAID